MSKSPRNSFRILFFLFLFLCLTTASCGFVEGISNLEPLTISSYPENYNQIIASGDTLRLSFSDPVETASLEGAITITSWRTRPDGNWVYTPTSATFFPSEPWEPGIRYVLQVTGSIATEDGRRHSQDLYLPFFADNTQAPLRLLSVDPAEGESLGVDESLRFTFNQAVDYRVFEDFFSLSPLVQGDYTWNTGTPEEDFYNEVTFTPEEGFRALQIYSWTIQEGTPSLAGTELWQSREGLFITQEVTEPPAVVDDPGTADRIEGLSRRTNDNFVFTAPPLGTEGLDHLTNGDVLFVSFTQDMDWSQGSEVLSFTPNIDGETLVHDPRTLVFLPAETWKDQEYTLEISGEVRSLLGLEMGDPVSESFTPDIRYQSFVLDISGSSTAAYDSASWPALNTAQALPLTNQTSPIVSPPRGRITLAFTFDDPYAVLDEDSNLLLPPPAYYQGREDIAGAIQFETYFPNSAFSPELVTTSWSPDYRTLTLEYKNMTYSTAAQPVYYRLRISNEGTNILSGAQTALDQEYALILEADIDS
jgi:hypothetical protein